jgi:Fe-S-cluster-containing hydrogenase component 2
MPIKIDYKKCCWKDGKCSSCSCGKACVGCVEVCPTSAIKRDKKVTVDLKKCISCGACVSACKHHAIILED